LLLLLCVVVCWPCNCCGQLLAPTDAHACQHAHMPVAMQRCCQCARFCPALLLSLIHNGYRRSAAKHQGSAVLEFWLVVPLRMGMCNTTAGRRYPLNQLDRDRAAACYKYWPFPVLPS
jgi:hypothetical protein